MSGRPSLKIGSLELGQGLVLAPMAGITDLSFRLTAKSFGADLVTTEMVSAEGLLRRSRGSWSALQSRPEEKPLAVQLFGANPQVVAEAARIAVAEGADIIDLNMGCPVPKVLRQGAGAELLKDVARVEVMVAAVRRAVAVPLTIKIRSGWRCSQVNAVEVSLVAERAGADAITIHPRTASQGFAGTADWSLISRVKGAVTIPVIGNGDVRMAGQVEGMRQMTGCDGVMIGRASRGNPWIFKEARQLAAGERPRPPRPSERLETMRRHLAFYEEFSQARPAVAAQRSLLISYSRTLPGSARLRAVLSRCRQTEAMLRVYEDYFALLERPRAAS